MNAHLFGLPGHEPLLRHLIAELGFIAGSATIGSFLDGERQVRIHDDVAGAPVVLVGSTGAPVDSNLMTMALLADAARRAGAHPILAVIPYFGYARSDHMVERGMPLGARVAADLLVGAGVDALVTLDLHNPAIPGFFRIPCDALSAAKLLATGFETANPETHVVVSPDAGGIKRASLFASLLGVPLAVAVKHRPAPDTPQVLHLWGDVRDRIAIIFDDMVSTGRTIETVGRLLSERRVRAIEVAATHAVMAPGAWNRLQAMGIARLVTTDSIPQPQADWEVISIAPLLLPAISRSLRGVARGDWEVTA